MTDIDISHTPAGNPSVVLGHYIDITFTATSSTHTAFEWDIVSEDYNNCITAKIISTGTNTVTVRVTAISDASDNDTFTLRCRAGSEGVRIPLLVYIVPDSGYVQSIQITGDDEIESEATAVFTAVTSPSTADNRHVTWSKSTGSSYFDIISQTDTTTGGRCTISTKFTSVTRRCIITATADDGGGVSANFVFDILPNENRYVQSISIRGPTTIHSADIMNYTATTSPTTALNRHVTWSIVSGSLYARITDTTVTSTGGICQLTAHSPGTVILRATAADDHGAYQDIVINIEAPPKSISVSVLEYAGSPPVVTYIGRLYTLRVLPYPTDEDYEVYVLSGNSVEVLTGSGENPYRVNVVALGTSIVRAQLTSDTSVYKDIEFDVQESVEAYPYDRTFSTFYYYGVEYGNRTRIPMANNIAGWPVIYHGGYATVYPPSGMRFYLGGTQYVDSIPPASQGGVTTTDGKIYLDGTPTHVGDSIILYGESTVECVRLSAGVIGEGSATKTVHFDANLPSGTTLNGSMPDDIVRDYAGETTNITMPECTATVDGYVFIAWARYKDLDHAADLCYPGANLVVEGDTQTVTMYAEWYPVTEGFERTDRFVFRRVIDAGEEVDITFLNRGDYPIGYQISNSASIPGVEWETSDGVYSQTIPMLSIESGNLSMRGMPTQQLGEPILLLSYGTRRYNIYYEIIVTRGQLPEPGQALECTLDANGGTFPNGAKSIQLTPEDNSYVLPDWSVVDRPGYRLTRWEGDESGAAEMGSPQMVIDTWRAVWAVDRREYDTNYLPHAAIRIYRDLDEYIDVTYLQNKGGNAIIQIAENQAGSASFTLINDYDTAGHNLMSSSCSLWSSGGAGAIKPGMYVRIDNILSDGTVEYVTDGFITTITPNAESVSVEVGDWLTFLGKMGATYRRNFYGDGRTEGIYDVGHDSSGLYADISEMPSDAVIDGNPYWKVLSATSTNVDIQTVVLRGGVNEVYRSTYTFDLDGDTLEDIRMDFGYHGQSLPGTYSFSITVIIESGSESHAYHWIKEHHSTGSLEWETQDFGDIGINLSGTVKITFRLNSYSGAGGYGEVYVRYSRSGSGSIDVGDTGSPYNAADIGMTITTGSWASIDDDSYDVQGNRLCVSSIDGVNNMDDESLWTPSEDRCRVPYITGSQSTVAIAATIANGLHMIPMPATSALAEDATQVMMFRTGGGYALDYLQKLADIASEDGRSRALCVRGYTTPVVVMSARHRLADTPLTHIRYGGDSVSGQSIPFSSFSPSLTMKNRPSVAVVRGTSSDRGETSSTPIIVAVENHDSTSRRFGLAVETVVADSSVNRAVDAANAAWAEVTANDLDEWEGTVIIPDVHRELIPPSGAYAGSGVAIRITDSRNGLSGVVVRARQLKIDYNACTTQVTLTNYSLVYSSGISNTAAMAITSADVATGDNSTTLFNTQYVRVVTKMVQTIRDSGNEVTGILGDGSSFNFEEISVLRLPTGRSVLVASAPADGPVHAQADRPYDVQYISINGGSRIEIRSSVRPDYYDGQTLVINVDFPTS